MNSLIHIIYCSDANQKFTREELTAMLAGIRRKNTEIGVTGILLYHEGSFFQVLEGDAETVDQLFARIQGDRRHSRITLIIREPIPERSFGTWTMGYSDITPREVDDILGVNDFFQTGNSFARMNAGRAKKLLTAFKQGRWRNKISDNGTPARQTEAQQEKANPPAPKPGPAFPKPERCCYSFAYQPIVNITTGSIYSYEALIRGANNESAGQVLKQIDPAEMHKFDELSRIQALELAAHLGLSTRLNLNFLPSSAALSPTSISSVLETAEKCHIRPEQIILEILEQEIIADFDIFTNEVGKYRSSGLLFAIDDFGSGYAGLNLLAEFQPSLIKLDMHLVHGIESKGPRQAIVRGILRTCFDLGIDIIAEGVETAEEFNWLHGEGIELFQGYFLSKPGFEQLPATIHWPKV